jgi:hypothetical protein
MGRKSSRACFAIPRKQIEGFEAHLGAQLTVLEAIGAVNKAAGKDDACSPISNVIVGDMEDVKEMTFAGKGYAVTRLSIIGVMMVTPSGMAPRFLAALEQYVVAKSKSRET